MLVECAIIELEVPVAHLEEQEPSLRSSKKDSLDILGRSKFKS